MRIAVIGLGSMGKRRIRLIIGHFMGHSHDESQVLGICGVDERDDRRQEVNELFHIPIFANLDEMVSAFEPDIAFVCTSPASHPKLTEYCLGYGLHVFSEINLINENHETLKTLSEEKQLLWFISSTPLYRRELQYVSAEIMGCKKPVNYIYHVGQYLPDWHPWENYRDFFVSDKSTNGCRELLCIELPWMIAAFGEIESYTVNKGNISTLEIDYPDNYMVLLKHKNGNSGVFCVDVVTRRGHRFLEVFGEELSIEWRGTPDSLLQYDIDKRVQRTVPTYNEVMQDEKYAQNIIENAYLDEIRDFFDCIVREKTPPHSAGADIALLDLVDKIEGFSS